VASRAERGAVRLRPAGPNIHDVARDAGVSIATVSRALRGVDHVSEATRARVLRAAAELGYTASPTATSLATGKTGVVAVLAPFLSRWYFAHALDGIEQALRRRGLHVLLVNVGTTVEGRTLLLERQLLRGRVDGLVVLSCDLSPAEVAVLASLHVPVVTVGVDLPPWDRVGIDDVAAGQAAMEHLLALGHRRLGYVGGDVAHDVNVATAVERLDGARRAVARAGLRPGAMVELVGDWSVAGGLVAGERLLGLPSPPTAVLAASDEMAVGVLCAARRRGVRVPAELSVVGIDDHEAAVTHDLTTIAQPVQALGATAAGLLVDVLDGTAAGRRSLTLPTRLLVRGSTAPPRSPESARGAPVVPSARPVSC
jgi:LacI family transcriptional regulator, repressor for deo operon, udp, cdd, tsx, nupC, and nupG